jgi:hypothetical protein
MDSQGFLWIPIDFYGFPWIPKDLVVKFNGNLWYFAVWAIFFICSRALSTSKAST